MHIDVLSGRQLYQQRNDRRAATPSGVILAYELTTANVYDNDAVSPLLKKLTGFEIGFALVIKLMTVRRFANSLQHLMDDTRKSIFACRMVPWIKWGNENDFPHRACLSYKLLCKAVLSKRTTSVFNESWRKSPL
jgi:hypothetical protein